VHSFFWLDCCNCWKNYPRLWILVMRNMHILSLYIEGDTFANIQKINPI